MALYLDFDFSSLNMNFFSFSLLNGGFFFSLTVILAPRVESSLDPPVCLDIREV